MFVSIVSTKIPFKGAGKEYIGDDIEEMVAAVKHAIQACGVQVGGWVGGWVLGGGADPGCGFRLPSELVGCRCACAEVGAVRDGT